MRNLMRGAGGTGGYFGARIQAAGGNTASPHLAALSELPARSGIDFRYPKTPNKSVTPGRAAARPRRFRARWP